MVSTGDQTRKAETIPTRVAVLGRLGMRALFRRRQRKFDTGLLSVVVFLHTLGPFLSLLTGSCGSKDLRFPQEGEVHAPVGSHESLAAAAAGLGTIPDDSMCMLSRLLY